MNDEAVVEQTPEYQVNLDDLKPQEHRWVDRGLVMSCEGAGHPPHRAFKKTAPKQEENKQSS